MKSFKQYLQIVQESYDAEHAGQIQADQDLEYLINDSHKFPDSLKKMYLSHEEFQKLILNEEKVKEIENFFDNQIKFLKDNNDPKKLNALHFILNDFTQDARIKDMNEKLTNDKSKLESYKKLNKTLETYKEKVFTRLNEVLNSKEENEKQEQQIMRQVRKERKEAARFDRVNNWTY